MAADTTLKTQAESAGIKPAVEAAQAISGQVPPGAKTSATTEQAPKSGGLPQFRFEFWGGQIVWLIFVFAILYLVLAKVFVPRLRKIQDTRAQTIADAVAQARRVQAEADAQAKAAQAELEEARMRARRLAAEAKAKAQAESAARQAAEDQRLQSELELAEARIRAMRDQAMTNVRSIALDAAEAMVAKLTGKSPARADLDAALAARSTEEAA